MNARVLKSTIGKAFSNVSPPSATCIAYRSDWNYEDITQCFSEYLDKPLPDEVMEQHGDSIAALLPDAFRYFIGQFALHCVRNPRSDAVDYVISNVETLERQISTDYYRDRIKKLSPEQLSALEELINFLKEERSGE